jgi:hypothetical protein
MNEGRSAPSSPPDELDERRIDNRHRVTGALTPSPPTLLFPILLPSRTPLSLLSPFPTTQRPRRTPFDEIEKALGKPTASMGNPAEPSSANGTSGSEPVAQVLMPDGRTIELPVMQVRFARRAARRRAPHALRCCCVVPSSTREMAVSAAPQDGIHHSL